MNVIRCTVVDRRGAVSFIAHGDALPALAASCAANPTSLEELLEQAEPFYHNLRDYVLNGLAIFEERNVEGNYQAIHGTPLYDQSVVLLGSVLAKAQDFARNGVVARSVTLLITDGADQHSTRCRARDVAALVRDLSRAEAHIVAAMGIHDGSTPFREVFREMGIEDRWILTPGNDPGEIRRAFQVFSQSAVRASQAASFSQAAIAGFVQ